MVASFDSGIRDPALPCTMLIVTNFSSFPSRWVASTGMHGRSVAAHSVAGFLRYALQPGAVLVVNCDPALLLKLAAVFRFVPFLRAPLISVDLVLRRPRRTLDRMTVILKRLLFSRVDHYIHYFKDLSGYREVFGIGPECSSFVPFKPNIRYRQNVKPQPDGEYVLCMGRSMRDYDTFIAAMERLPYPGAITKPGAQLLAHGAQFSRDLAHLPGNLRILDDTGDEESQIRLLGGARLVVLSILKSNMAASGISTALNAMLLGKCVIGSEGPGISDVFSDELLTVPPEDPLALAGIIERAWTDEDLRTKTATAGNRYALSLGGEPELYQRIINQVVCCGRQGRR